MTKHEPFCPMINEEAKPAYHRLIGVRCTCRKDRGRLAQIAEDALEKLSDFPIGDVELTKQKDTLESKRFWESAEESAREVESWPAWKRLGTAPENEMSGKPSPEGAKRAVEILTRCAQLTETIGTLGPEVRSKTAQLKALEEERHGLQRELGQLMRSMDCDAPGNMGWEGRVTWLVAEMFKQMKEEQDGEVLEVSCERK